MAIFAMKCRYLLRARRAVAAVALLALTAASPLAAQTPDTLADQIGLPSPIQRYIAPDPASEPVPEGTPDPTGLLAALAQARALVDAGKFTTAQQRYREIAARVGDDAQLGRRTAISWGWACALHVDYACALAQWQQAGRSAQAPPRWLPSSYAYALWGAGRHEQALAWYDVAVLGGAQLGDASYVERRFDGTALNAVAKNLFKAWSEQLAPLRKAVTTAVEIDPLGNVERVQVLDDEVDPRLAQKVQAAIAGWHFEPTLKDGRPARLATHVYVEVRGRPLEAGGMSLDVQYAGQGVRVAHRVAPHYPIAMLEAQRGGVVLVAADIAADGSVSAARVAETTADVVLNQAALAALKQWRFDPERVDGEPVASSVLQPVHFEVAEGNRPQPTAGALRRAQQHAEGHRPVF